MSKTYLEKIFSAALIATGGNKKCTKELVVARAASDETLLCALAERQMGELVDLNFSEYQQAQTKPANTPRLNEDDLDRVIAHIETNESPDIEPLTTHKKPSWKAASSNLVVMKTGQKSLNKKELDHILDHYFN